MKYIHPENQKILWEKMNKTVIFKNSELSIQEKQEWFKQIIQLFYDQYKNTHISTLLLKEINRKTILFMINDLTNKHRSIQSINDSLYIHESSQPPKLGVENEFQQRQQEYESMMKPVVPTEITFNEKIKDDVITNMEELLKNHREQRESEFSFLPLEKKVDTPINQDNTEKLTYSMMNRESLVTNQVDELFIPISPILSKEKNREKKIQWSNHLEENTFIDSSSMILISPPLSPSVSPLSKNKDFEKSMETEMKQMKHEIVNLREIVETLSNQIKQMKKDNQKALIFSP